MGKYAIYSKRTEREERCHRCNRVIDEGDLAWAIAGFGEPFCDEACARNQVDYWE